MTKQEQIEEITRIIDSDICNKDCPNRCPYCGALSKREAETLYDAGYRKADDVRKKTAREILDKLNSLMEQYHYKSTAWRNCADFIKETYGVEVEQ